MKCSKCNAEIDDNARFCPECGNKIEKLQFCANCGAKLEEGATFCSNCGEKIESLPAVSQEKMKCPYCGEEILATAKKCKHCGEWLDDSDDEIENEIEANTVASVTEDEETLLKQNVPLKNTILEIAFWCAIIGVGIYTLHDLLPEGFHLRLKGKLSILSLCTIIPEWVGNILEPVGLTILLFSLKQAMSKLNKNFDILFTLLIVTICGGCLFNIINEFADDYSFGLLLLLSIFWIAEDIITLILGIKIKAAYKGDVNALGTIMVVYGIVEMVLTIILIFGIIMVGVTTGDEDDMYWLLLVNALANAGVAYFYYKKLKDVQLHS